MYDWEEDCPAVCTRLWSVQWGRKYILWELPTSPTHQEMISHWFHRQWGVQVADLQNSWEGGWCWPRYDLSILTSQVYTDFCSQMVRKLISLWWMMRRCWTSLVPSKIPWLLTQWPWQKGLHLQMIPFIGAWRLTHVNFSSPCWTRGNETGSQARWGWYSCCWSPRSAQHMLLGQQPRVQRCLCSPQPHFLPPWNQRLLCSSQRSFLHNLAILLLFTLLSPQRQAPPVLVLALRPSSFHTSLLLKCLRPVILKVRRLKKLFFFYHWEDLLWICSMAFEYCSYHVT